MARRDNGKRISPVGRSDRACGAGMPDLPCNLCVGSGLPERDLQQRTPHLLLKRRAGRGEWQIELPALPCEVLAQLPRGLDEDRMTAILRRDLQANTPGSIVLPEDRREAIVAPDQHQPADGRVHQFINVALVHFRIRYGHCARSSDAGDSASFQSTMQRAAACRWPFSDAGISGLRCPNLASAWGHSERIVSRWTRTAADSTPLSARAIRDSTGCSSSG
jgi:hypothetical protein